METTNGITNRELGELLGCTHSMASRLRAGKRLPGPSITFALNERLGIPWEVLMDARARGQVAFGRMLRERLEIFATERAA